MRVALCISGSLRQYEACYYSLNKYVLTPLNCDVFLSTWYTTVPYKQCNTHNPNADERQYDIEKAIKTYNPKLHNIELYDEQKRQELVDFSGFECQSLKVQDALYCYIHPILGQFYQIYQVHRLKQIYEHHHNFKYDYVIRTRPDILYFNEITQEKLLEINKESNIIYQPKRVDYGNMGNDQVIIGTSDNMNKFSNLYFNIDQLFQACSRNRIQRNKCNVHLLVRRHMNKQGLKLLTMNNIFCAVYYQYKNQRQLWNRRRKRILKKRKCV